MTPEQVLSTKPKILTQKQREFYFENGYLLLEKLLPDSWIERLRAATDEMVEQQPQESPNPTRSGTSTRATRRRTRGCAGCRA